ncbi:hypothetical protein ABTA44_20430, partial [Acinetobacter baumannii]
RELKDGIDQATKDVASLHQPDTAGSTVTPIDRINQQIADLNKKRNEPGADKAGIDKQIAGLSQAQGADAALMNLKAAALQRG